MLQKYKLHQDIVLRESDRKVLVLATGNVVELNESGIFILQAFTNPQTASQILGQIQKEWGIENATERQEVENWLGEFINMAIAEGILSPIDG
jgi:hypothetical protein